MRIPPWESLITMVLFLITIGFIVDAYIQVLVFKSQTYKSSVKIFLMVSFGASFVVSMILSSVFWLLKRRGWFGYSEDKY